MRRTVRVVLLTLGLFVPVAQAHATCFSSTPSSAAFADSTADGDAGLAPEILSVVATSDAMCNLVVQDVLAGAVAPGDLIDGESVGIYLDTDGNPATGSPIWGGADRVVIIVGMAGLDLGPGLGVWNGGTFDFAGAPLLTPVGAAGFVASLDQLGIPAPAGVGMRTITIWEGVFDTYADFAPEVFADPFTFPVAFSNVAPPLPPVPAPPPPVAVTSPAPRTAGCRVPGLVPLRLAAALTRLRRAGCRYRVVRVRHRLGVGRVVSTRPAAGQQTSDRVVVRVSRGRARATDAASSTLYAAAQRRMSAAAR